MALSLHRWLSCADPLRRADVIFVLAGRENRKQHGLELFRRGLAPRILFSVTRFEIRRFSNMLLPAAVDLLKPAADISPFKRHFFVLLEGGGVRVEYVRPGRLGTLTEIESLARWLGQSQEIHSLLIISGSTHLRRLRLCCRALLDTKIDITMIAAADSSSATNKKRQSTLQSAAADLKEFLKVVLYWALLAIRRYFKSQDQRP